MPSRSFRDLQARYILLTNAAFDIAIPATAAMGEANTIAILRRPTSMCLGSTHRMVMAATGMGVPGATADITTDTILAVTTEDITGDITAGTTRARTMGPRY